MIQDFLFFLVYVIIVQTITFIIVAFSMYLYYKDSNRYKTLGKLFDDVEGVYYVPILSTIVLILNVIIGIVITFGAWFIKVTKLHDLWKKIKDIKI